MRCLTRLTCLCLVMSLCCLAGPSQAAREKDDFQAYGLGDLVVTGDKLDARQVAIDTVVTAQDIEATNSKTVAEALQYAPGVVVTSGRKAEPDVQIHGFGQDKILVLIDGVPYHETNYRKLNLKQIPSDIVSRIEVVKNAPSVLYGANAAVAVINIITKKASDKDGKPVFALRGEFSENDTYRASLTSGIKADALNFWFNYTHRETDGYPMSDDYEPRTGTIVRKPGRPYDAVLQDGDYRRNSQHNVDSLWLRVGVEPSEDSEYFVSLHRITASRGVPPNVDEERVFMFRPAFSGLAKFDHYDDWGFDVSGRQAFGDKFNFKAKLFYHNHKDNYISYGDENYSQEISDSSYKDYFLGGNLIGEFLPADGHALRAALHYKGDSHKERDDAYLPYAETFSYTGSTGLEYQFDGVSGLLFTAGLSYDWFEIDRAELTETNKDGDFMGFSHPELPSTKNEFNPMVGLSYTFSDSTRVFGSVARKTRFPTLQELFSSKSGNIELEAEQSMNYTLGVGRDFGEMVSVELAGFYHDISDWISRDGPWVDSKYRNYSDVQIYGAEFGVTLRPMQDLTLSANYTYAHGKDESEGAVTDKVLQVPEHKLDLGLGYMIPVLKVKLDLTGLYVSDRYSQLPSPQNPDEEEIKDDSYFVGNLRLGKDFCDHFEGYFSVKNLADENYEPEKGYPAAGRSFWVGFIARF